MRISMKNVIREQTREEMRKKIQDASSKKILRRQMELLAEYSRTSGVDRIPEASEAMATIHRRLIKTECVFFVRIMVSLFTLLYFFKCFYVKGIKLING